MNEDLLQYPEQEHVARSRFYKKLFVLVFPPILCCLSYIGFVWWERGALPGFRPTIYDREIEDLSLNDRGVRVHGWARHDIRTHFEKEGQKYYIYPIVPMDKMNDKVIHAMVVTTIEPDSMISIEEVVVEGLTQPAKYYVSKDLQMKWTMKGYAFGSRFLVIERFDDLVNTQKKKE